MYAKTENDWNIFFEDKDWKLYAIRYKVSSKRVYVRTKERDYDGYSYSGGYWVLEEPFEYPVHSWLYHRHKSRWYPASNMWLGEVEMKCRQCSISPPPVVKVTFEMYGFGKLPIDSSPYLHIVNR